MKIEITEDLIMKVAREQFAALNDGVLDDQREYVRVGWVNGAAEILDDFNELVDIFEKLHYKCSIDNYGCGWDVEEYYMSEEE